MQIEKLALAEAEDTRDAEIARKCVADIAANPDATVRGEQLEEKLEQWLIE
jgi:hypothetical protein